MFDSFKAAFTETASVNNIFAVDIQHPELLLELGGKTYANGLYTILTLEQSQMWTQLLTQYFEIKDPSSSASAVTGLVGYTARRLPLTNIL